MRIKKFLQPVLFLSMVAFLAGAAHAQQPIPKKDTGVFRSGYKMSLKGQIGYQTNMGGYYVKGETPPTSLLIQNQNPGVLEKLYMSKRTVTIDGHATAGSNYLFIEKIDGQPY
jgi:hypothetical protein